MRLKGWDYTSAGHYFVTVCTHEKRRLFWERKVFVGADNVRPQPPALSDLGKMVNETIQDIPNHYPNVLVDKYVVMPNHIHMILILQENGRMVSAPTKSVSTIIGQMKRVSSKMAGQSLWQKGFYDHIIRNEPDYLCICQYVDENPAKWSEDEYYIP